MFNLNQLLSEVLGAFIQTQTAKASTWITKHVGNPSSPWQQTAIQIGQAAIGVGVAAITAKPDHPELRAVAGNALNTIEQALNSSPSASNAITETSQSESAQ